LGTGFNLSIHGTCAKRSKQPSSGEIGEKQTTAVCALGQEPSAAAPEVLQATAVAAVPPPKPDSISVRASSSVTKGATNKLVLQGVCTTFCHRAACSDCVTVQAGPQATTKQGHLLLLLLKECSTQVLMFLVSDLE